MPSTLKKSLWLMFVSLLFAFPAVIPFSSAQSESSPGNLQFNYAFVALPDTNDSSQLITVESKFLLKSGDKLKFYLEALSDAYFYLFHLGPGGELSQIFPDGGQTARMTPDQRIMVPGGNQWLELDSQTGMEKFYLIASLIRQDRLENLYRDYLTTEGEASKQRSVKDIIDEINSIRRKNLSKNAERPVRIGGNFRGPKQDDPDTVLDISDLASNVSTNGTYSRSFTIDHR
jgi:hypothetical protein